MASNVEIVNQALALLGDDPITALSDNTERARLANRILNPTTDSVLRACTWNCAKTRRALALLADAPVFGWSSQFQLPTNPYCLRVISVNNHQENEDGGSYYKIEGRTLLVNETEANIVFIKRITDPNEYDSLLYDAIGARLAAKMAVSLTGSSSMAEQMWALYTGMLREAISVNGMEDSVDIVSDSIISDVR